MSLSPPFNPTIGPIHLTNCARSIARAQAFRRDALADHWTGWNPFPRLAAAFGIMLVRGPFTMLVITAPGWGGYSHWCGVELRRGGQRLVAPEWYDWGAIVVAAIAMEGN
jgi:hypothetical protein